MRALAILFSIFWCLEVEAQQQETSLVERLLRPNMELRNSDQTKNFTTSKPARIDHGGSVGTFYLQSNRKEKQFAGTADYSTTEYQSRQFTSEKRTAIVTQDPVTTAQVSSPPTREMRAAYDAHNGVASREFSGQREYRERGKSQKSLDRQNPPMTIDQVRELLNKNK